MVYSHKLPKSSIWSPVLCSEMDCKFRFYLYSKGHRKDSDKSRSRKDDDSLAEASHSKKTVKKAGNGVIPKLVQFSNGLIHFFHFMAQPVAFPRCFGTSQPVSMSP